MYCLFLQSLLTYATTFCDSHTHNLFVLDLQCTIRLVKNLHARASAGTSLLVDSFCEGKVTSWPAMQVWWPWASAVWGEVQFELLMAVLWENMAEPCSFGPQRPPPFPIGKSLLHSLSYLLLF